MRRAGSGGGDIFGIWLTFKSCRIGGGIIDLGFGFGLSFWKSRNLRSEYSACLREYQTGVGVIIILFQNELSCVIIIRCCE